MRHAILADTNGNLTALTAVLDDIERRGGVDGVWCLGDVVGYGPEPSACIDRLRETTDVCVAGNHDRAAGGKIDTADFNPAAAIASRWTAGRLSPQGKEYLGDLPPRLVRGDFTMVHGSPRDPIWEYLVSGAAAAENLAHFETRYCLVGHTHVPMVFAAGDGGVDGSCTARHWTTDDPVILEERRLIVNPGSIGQPRDGDPRASYAIHDGNEGSLRLYRVGYDVRATQKKMQALGLPERLISRLEHGL
ncbi:MAG: metallophosphoesterase family protein [Dehalococcoidales bacterium]